MDGECEVIALLLDEAEGSPRTLSELVRHAQCLTRDADGHMALRPIESEAQLDETARTSGCFRRGKEIRDPESHEVIGYEMEAVSLGSATQGR